MSLVTVGIPTRNGAARIEGVVRSVLAQDHEKLQVLISDNGSTDNTEEVCRELARADGRIVYHRHPQNVGLLNNFIGTMQRADGEFFRWVGDDDRLEPGCVSRTLRLFDEDPRLLLVTCQVAYTDENTGSVQTGAYDGVELNSDDPVERLTELTRMLNESYVQLDPLYALFRRAQIVAIPRRNMLREDQVFAAKLALAGPWGHVPEVLAHRNWKTEKAAVLTRRLQVPAWQARCQNILQVRETLAWLRRPEVADRLSPEQRRRARSAVYRMYLRRHQRLIKHRAGRIARLDLHR